MITAKLHNSVTFKFNRIERRIRTILIPQEEDRRFSFSHPISVGSYAVVQLLAFLDQLQLRSRRPNNCRS